MAERCDVLVIGAGPGGLAAATAAARHGARVLVVDAQARPGGQIWRHDVARGAPRAAREALAALQAQSRIAFIGGAQVVDADAGTRSVLIEHADGARELRGEALVLATGARELLLPFPGWTLPGVSGTGGLQALVKQGWPIAGRRVVVAGSGPLLLAAAATLRAHGAAVLAIVEQAPAARVAAFAARLPRWPRKLAQALALRAALLDVPYRCGALVRAAHGDLHVQAVEIDDGRRTERIECDAVAVGYGLVPNVELALRLGCALAHHGAHPHVHVDALQRTSVAGVYAVGEACGIGGVDAARSEGAIAGLAAVGAERHAQRSLRQRDHARRFAAVMTEHFTLDARARALATADTVACRCEDVTVGALDSYADPRDAKLATRCGMGACQGRICGAALAELKGWPVGPPRPPLRPARLATLARIETARSSEPRIPA